MLSVYLPQLPASGQMGTRTGVEEAFALGEGWEQGCSLKPERRLCSLIVLVPRTMRIVSGESLFQKLEIG